MSYLQILRTKAEWQGIVPTALDVVCEPVDFSSDKVRACLPDVARELFRTMYATMGVGMAASQVGILWQMAVIHPNVMAPSVLDGEPRILINPLVEKMGQEESSAMESCMSLPGLRGEVRRPDRIRVTSCRLDGSLEVFELSGFSARVVQHEADHLNGLVYWAGINPADLERTPDGSSGRLADKAMAAILKREAG